MHGNLGCVQFLKSILVSLDLHDNHVGTVNLKILKSLKELQVAGGRDIVISFNY